MGALKNLARKVKKLKKQKKSKKGEINKESLKDILPIRPKIVEAGAHIGRDTIDLAKLWPAGKIFAFEPVNEIFSQLIKNTQPYKNISCYRQALSYRNGTQEIYISSGSSNGSSSLLFPKEHLKVHPEVLFIDSEIVSTTTLDSWAEETGITVVDFLWLDLQGMELSVLKASKNIMKTVKAIYTEVNLLPLYKNAPLYPEFKAWLLEQGFCVQKEYLPWKDAGNVLFVKKNI